MEVQNVLHISHTKPEDNSYYKGHCQNLEMRLIEHNSGSTKSIKSKLPFVIVYYEEFLERASAVAREKYFKSAADRRFLKDKLAQQSQ